MSSSLTNVHTEVKPERITFIWSIKRFDLFPEDIGECRYSPWFYWANNTEKWRLEFYPRVERDDSSEDSERCPLFDIDNSEDFINDLSIYLARDSPGKSHITVHTELKISKFNTILKNLSFTGRYGPQDTRGYTRPLKASKLFITKSENDDLTISCIIDTTMEVITSSFDAKISNLRNGELRDDLRSLFKKHKFSDLTIIVGNERFPVHKNILAQRSSFFAAMLDCNDRYEKHSKEMKIKNIEPDVMRGLLEFIYTDQVSNIKELASGLFEAADEYDLEKLRIMCEKVLYGGLSKQNATEVLLLAARNRADTLKERAMKYIVDHAPEVVKTTNWKETNWNHELLLELFDQLALSQTNSSFINSSKA